MSDNFLFGDGSDEDERDPPITPADHKKHQRSKQNRTHKKY